MNRVCSTLLRAVSIATLLLAASTLLSQTPAPSDQQTCPNSTIDAQGAEVAQKSRAFLSQLQTAVSKNNRAQIASMISYPLLVIHGARKMRIKSEAQFLSQYDAIFDAHVRQAIAQQSAKCLFGNYQGAMIGDGEVWFREQQDGSMKIVTVNPSAGNP